MRFLDRFKEYTLTPETSLFGKLKNILFGVVLYIGWSSIVLWIYETHLPEVFNVPRSMSPPHSMTYMFITICIWAPIFEEILYRLPLSIARNFQIKNLVLYTAIISSILFGQRHWGADWTVPIQGVLGFIFCWVYIKNGYSLLSSVLMHFLINLYTFIS